MNRAGLLTRFPGACSPSSRHDLVERPRGSRQRARGCPCLTLCPTALGDRSPRCRRAPWQGEGRLGLQEPGPSSSSLSSAGWCRWHGERYHTGGQRDTAPPLDLPHYLGTAKADPPRPPDSHLSPPNILAGDRTWGEGSWGGVHIHPWCRALSQGRGPGVPQAPQVPSPGATLARSPPLRQCAGWWVQDAPGEVLVGAGWWVLGARCPCQLPPASVLLPAVAFRVAAKHPACCQQPSGGNSTAKVFPSIQTGNPSFLLGFVPPEAGLLQLALAFQQAPLRLNHGRDVPRAKAEGKQQEIQWEIA